MKMKYTFLLLLGTLMLCGCRKHPIGYEGRWYYDMDEFASLPRYIEFKDNGVLIEFDGFTKIGSRWEMNGEAMTVQLSDAGKCYPVMRTGDRLQINYGTAGKTLALRPVDNVNFTKSILGTWTNSNTELLIHEGGWAALRNNAALTPIRLEKENQKITWSMRVFDKRTIGEITLLADGELEFRWPNGSSELLRRQK